jgi:hypothetical protein
MPFGRLPDWLEVKNAQIVSDNHRAPKAHCEVRSRSHTSADAGSLEGVVQLENCGAQALGSMGLGLSRVRGVYRSLRLRTEA